MGFDFGFGLALLFISWGTPLVGCIPVLIGWSRVTSLRSSTGERSLPRGLNALTASICIDPVGFSVATLVDRLDPTSLDLANALNRLSIISLVVGFILSLTALVMAARARNVARAVVLAGSISVAAVNVLGFIWLFSSSRGMSLWTR